MTSASIQLWPLGLCPRARLAAFVLTTLALAAGVLTCPGEVSAQDSRVVAVLDGPGKKGPSLSTQLVEGLDARGTIVVTVFDGATGNVVGSIELSTRRGVLKKKDVGFAVDETMNLISLTGWPEVVPEPIIEAPPLADPTTELSPLVEEEDDGPDRPKEGPLLIIEGGVSAIKRDFDVVSASAGLEYSTGLYAGFRVDADLYPYPWGGEWIGNLGITGRFLRGSDTVKLILAEGEQALESTHTEWSLGAVFRKEFSPTLSLRFGLGFESLDFVLADNPVYSSTAYRALWLSAHINYGIVDRLSLVGGINALPWVGLGDTEAEFGTGSSAFGVVVDLALSYDIVSGLYVRGGYRLRAITTTFEGQGTRQIAGEALVDVKSNDFVQEPSLWLGYRY